MGADEHPGQRGHKRLGITLCVFLYVLLGEWTVLASRKEASSPSKRCAIYSPFALLAMQGCPSGGT